MTTTTNPESTAEGALAYHLRLVLDNDYEAYQQRRAMVQAFLANDDAEMQYPHILGDQLKDWCEGMIESTGLYDQDRIGALLTREIVSTASAYIDWRKLAEEYIEEEQEG